jgi:hypothetical protein
MKRHLALLEFPAEGILGKPLTETVLQLLLQQRHRPRDGGIAEIRPLNLTRSAQS